MPYNYSKQENISYCTCNLIKLRLGIGICGANFTSSFTLQFHIHTTLQFYIHITLQFYIHITLQFYIQITLQFYTPILHRHFTPILHPHYIPILHRHNRWEICLSMREQNEPRNCVEYTQRVFTKKRNCVNIAKCLVQNK
jgi:hypothetical protein